MGLIKQPHESKRSLIFNTEGLKDSSTCKDIHLDPIKISKIKNKSNPFLLVGSNSLEPYSSSIFFKLYSQLLEKSSENLLKIEKLLSKVDKELRVKVSKQRNSKNQSILFRQEMGMFESTNRSLINYDTFSNDSFDFNINEYLSLKTGMKSIHDYFKNNFIVVEFPDKIIQVHAYNEFSILMAETKNAMENMHFMQFIQNLEKVGENKHMRFKRSYEKSKNNRRIQTGVSKQRVKLGKYPQKHRLISAKNTRSLYPHNKARRMGSLLTTQSQVQPNEDL